MSGLPVEIKGAGLKGMISENKNESLSLLRVIESFGQKKQFFWMGG